VAADGPDHADGVGHGAALDLEREMLIDILPGVFRAKAPKPAEPVQQSQPARLSLTGMTPEERTQLAVELAHSVPFPSSLKKLAFGAYRLWFRLTSSRADG
jgi:hypothetical protein